MVVRMAHAVGVANRHLHQVVTKAGRDGSHPLDLGQWYENDAGRDRQAQMLVGLGKRAPDIDETRLAFARALIQPVEDALNRVNLATSRCRRRVQPDEVRRHRRLDGGLLAACVFRAFAHGLAARADEQPPDLARSRRDARLEWVVAFSPVGGNNGLLVPENIVDLVEFPDRKPRVDEVMEIVGRC